MEKIKGHAMSNEINWDANGLAPAIVQDRSTQQVLMLAYMNADALAKTFETGIAHFWSRRRGTLWMKGETSKNFQRVREIRYDCDGDTILLLVDPQGPACHTGERTCFYRSLGMPKG
ncbi:MAG: phosphoribosyl-AMP cyclohydrolase [Chloroflexi bacterium]|nr:phosphoribosyl-AMP cyclohydrolase [Chloroflexota bacterium]